jgi:hypothetical protein
MASPHPLNEQVLDRHKRRVIRLQAELVREGQFFLAGGTGLGLRLGHRLSDDLDWFTPKHFDASGRAYYGDLETSFITYEQIPARPEYLKIGGTTIPVADMEILAAMKAAVVHDRGARRDLIDVHGISTVTDWSVGRFIEHGARQLPLTTKQLAMAVTYFDDAEREPMPKGCKVSWKTVRRDLIEGVRDWERARTRGPER